MGMWRCEGDVGEEEHQLYGRSFPRGVGVAEDVAHEGRAIAEGARERMDGEC
jgi:hypothetical protein